MSFSDPSHHAGQAWHAEERNYGFVSNEGPPKWLACYWLSFETSPKKVPRKDTLPWSKLLNKGLNCPALLEHLHLNQRTAASVLLGDLLDRGIRPTELQ